MVCFLTPTVLVDLTEILIQEHLFADDAAIVTDNLDDIQLLMNTISTALNNWGLIISIS